jgi:uncharacterized protein YcsI (UPF0317 family)
LAARAGTLNGPTAGLAPGYVQGNLVAVPADVAEEIPDASHLWRERDDLVAFVLGCAFTFEEALVAAGIQLKHLTSGTNVAMYRTSIQCERAGPFAGLLVVSMRPLAGREACARMHARQRPDGGRGRVEHATPRPAVNGCRKGWRGISQPMA